MAFKIGDRVLILETGINAIVTDVPDPHLLIVNIEGKEEVYFVDEVVDSAQKISIESEGAIGALNEQINTGPLILTISKVDAKIVDGNMFQACLLNQSEVTFIVEASVTFKGIIKQTWKTIIQAGEEYELDKFLFVELNETPKYNFRIKIVPSSPDKVEIFEKEIKLKPTSFFKKLASGHETGKKQVSIPLFDFYPEQKPVVWNESESSPNIINLIKDNEVGLKAHFPHEIDLHIEKIKSNHQKLSSQEKLQYQLQAFENYLAKAIELKLVKIHIIHGVGRGVLRKEIEKRLKDCPEVDTFVNEYHAKYEFGATEVIFINQ